MRAVQRILGWLGGKAIVYVALVLAILAGAFVSPWVKAQWTDPAHQLSLARRVESQVIAPLTLERGRTQRRLHEAGREAQGKGLAELDQAIVQAQGARAQAVKARRSVRDKAVSLATGDSDALLRDGRRELEIQYREAELAGLQAARARLAQRDRLAGFPADVAAARGEADQARAVCRTARVAWKEAEARWAVRATFGLAEQSRRRALKDRRDELCNRSIAADRRQIALQRAQNLAERSLAAAQTWTTAQIQPVSQDLEAWIADERIAAEGSTRQRWSRWVEEVHLPAVLRQAASALLVIVAAPYGIRLICYFVLAPLVMRRPAVRVLAGEGRGERIPSAEPSTTSVGIRLLAGEELLVRNGYLQTTSDLGGKGTQWFLDVRHPVTSLVTGLSFLTRIRGEGELTTVSAVRDPFAEVTILTLPPGASCVLQPRALAAVVQPIDHRLQVTSHWRLASLNAWLTLQLRYLAFHGPVRLVLKGSRGVRVERAERGRILGQDQVVGFSSDLAYSVTRNETFWPYFLGREPLLKDRVAAGAGIIIAEEAPMAGRRPGEVAHGIEGMIDAGMKVFGL